MPDLRTALAGTGFEEVRTYLHSGNVVISSDAAPEDVARECESVIARRFGLDIDVVVRTRDELAEVVRRDPLGEVAVDPKRYQVTFLAAELGAETVRKLEATAVGEERLVVHRLEVYAWHPEGAARSRLWALLANRGLGVTATARNWSTVTKLLALADE